MAARIAAALGGLLAGLALPAAPACAAKPPLTREQADANALGRLKPQSKTSRTGVVVYGSSKALKAGTDVFELPVPKAQAGKKRRALRRARVAPLAHAAWLYWMDTKRGTRF